MASFRSSLALLRASVGSAISSKSIVLAYHRCNAKLAEIMNRISNSPTKQRRAREQGSAAQVKVGERSGSGSTKKQHMLAQSFLRDGRASTDKAISRNRAYSGAGGGGSAGGGDSLGSMGTP